MSVLRQRGGRNPKNLLIEQPRNEVVGDGLEEFRHNDTRGWAILVGCSTNRMEDGEVERMRYLDVGSALHPTTAHLGVAECV